MSGGSISVILPVFNGRRYLLGAVDSVLRQTRLPDELIVIDDGSADGSADLLDGLDAPFPVRIVRQPNAGQSAARNQGWRLASGELLAFLDQDDEWLPAHLELLAGRFEANPDLGWVYSDFDEIDGDGAIVTHAFLREFGVKHPKTTASSCVTSDLMVLPSASLMRKSAFAGVGGFDEDLCGYEDDDLFLRFFRAGWRHAFVARPTTRFRIHGGSSSVSARFLESRLRFAEKIARLLPDDPRLHRYYVRDSVAPRFFWTTLDDYVRACSARDWQQAELALAALQHFARLRRPQWRLRLKMLAVASPRLFRLMMSVNDRLPGPLRWTGNPLVHLR